ncbi:MAG: polyprenyl diphosphate synthase [Oscillospiraceae bacterium]|nr:polyprenyl diphosphate synthase [Oscillospiraceae bacterium]
MGLFKKKRINEAGKPDFSRLPRHVAIILDGNGRWAKKRGLPRKAGHAVGAETFRTMATYCRDIGIEYLTVYAFSTENWKRPQQEVDAIMKLLEDFLREAVRDLEKNRVRIRILGDLEPLSPELKRMIARTEEESSVYPDAQVNICVNYGGRAEILHAAECFYREHPGHEGSLSEEDLNAYLYTAGMPEPDLLIRPGGECRLSNFLMWQTAYSELYFTDTLWPDFTTDDMDRALVAFQSRDRRFGGVKA